MLARLFAPALGATLLSAALFLAACASIVPAVYAELFPTRIRTVGTAIPYALCVAIFGGTAAAPHSGGLSLASRRVTEAGSAARGFDAVRYQG